MVKAIFNQATLFWVHLRSLRFIFLLTLWVKKHSNWIKIADPGPLFRIPFQQMLSLGIEAQATVWIGRLLIIDKDKITL